MLDIRLSLVIKDIISDEKIFNPWFEQFDSDRI